jgi:hypothetical protein
MRIPLVFTALMILTIPMNAESGMSKFGTETLNDIHLNGFVTLSGTTIINDMIINGGVEATNAHIGKVNVTGSVFLKNSSIKGISHINGGLEADNTVFSGNLIVETTNIKLVKCTTQSIQIQSSGGFYGIQTLYLERGCVIKGSITFDSGQGQIIMDKESKIEGKIFGGEIVKSWIKEK